MYRLLIPVAGNPDIAHSQAQYAIDLPSATTDVAVTVLHVFPDVHAAEEAGNVDVGEYADEPDSVRAAVDALESAGVTVEVRRESGDPADEIVAVIDDIDPDGVVVGGKRRSPIGKALLGSVTQSIVSNADPPVTVAERLTT